MNMSCKTTMTTRPAHTPVTGAWLVRLYHSPARHAMKEPNNAKAPAARDMHIALCFGVPFDIDHTDVMNMGTVIRNPKIATANPTSRTGLLSAVVFSWFIMMNETMLHRIVNKQASNTPHQRMIALTPAGTLADVVLFWGELDIGDWRYWMWFCSLTRLPRITQGSRRSALSAPSTQVRSRTASSLALAFRAGSTSIRRPTSQQQ
jgi:hypothetical protein